MADDVQTLQDNEAIEKARRALIAWAVAQLLKRAGSIVWLSWLTWPGVSVLTEIALNRILTSLSKIIKKAKDKRDLTGGIEGHDFEHIERQAKLAFGQTPV